MKSENCRLIGGGVGLLEVLISMNIDATVESSGSKSNRKEAE